MNIIEKPILFSFSLANKKFDNIPLTISHLSSQIIVFLIIKWGFFYDLLSKKQIINKYKNYKIMIDIDTMIKPYDILLIYLEKHSK